MKTFAKIKSGAFTLIELLAAMTITTVLVLVIVALTSRGVDIWRWVLQDVRTTTLARTAMDTMTKDFESMQFRAGNPFEWMLVQRDSDLVSRATKTTASTPSKAKTASAAVMLPKTADSNWPAASLALFLLGTAILGRPKRKGD